MADANKKLLGGVVGAVGLISVLTLLSRIAGFFRWFTQSAWVGTGAFANAYSSANQIPNVLFEVVAGGALTGVTIPLLAGPIAKKLRKDVSDLASAILMWTLIGLTPIALVLFFAAHPIATVLPSPVGVDHDLQVKLITTFLKIFTLQIPLYGICVVLSGVLQAHKKFFWPALAPLLNSIVVITTFAIFGYMTPNPLDAHSVTYQAQLALAWGTTGGVFVMAASLVIPTMRLKVRLRPRLAMEHDKAMQALRLGGSGMVALLAQQFSVVVILFVARNYGGPGTLPIYQYAQAVYMLPYAVLAYPVATAMFPRLAEAVAAGKTALFNKECSLSTRVVTVIGLVSGALLVGEALPAQAVFSLANPVPGMAEGLIAMAPGLVGYVTIFHLQRVLYTLDAGGAAMIAASSGWLVVSGASWLFSELLAGDRGEPVWTMIALGLAQSLGMIVAGIGLLIAVRRLAGKEALHSVGKGIALWSVASIVIAVAAWGASWGVLHALGHGLLGALVAALAAAAVVALLAAPGLMREMKKEKNNANS